MGRLLGAWLAGLRRDAERKAPEDSGPVYSLRRRGAEAVEVVARGTHVEVTQTLFDAVREMGASAGVALVEYREAPREWVASAVPAATLLEGLLAIRDLLGTAALDVAVFSTPRHLEVILDRHGILEIRAGAWNEPRIRSLIARGPYVEDASLTPLPRRAPPDFAWTLESDARFRRVKELLGVGEPGGSSVEGAG